MKSLINGESLKELNALERSFTASITTRLNANGVVLDDVLWVYDTLRNRDNYHALVRHNHTVGYLARFNKACGVMERLNAVLHALNVLWNDYAVQYNRIVAHGVLCSTHGAWDVFRSLRKKLGSGKPFAFTVSNFRLESVSPLYPKDILLKYGKNFEKSLRFIRCGASFRVSYDRLVSYPAWLNTSTGKVEYHKDGLLQDVLSILQAPIWEPEELPTHVCFMMCPPAYISYIVCPTAFITSILGLTLESTSDELGASELFDLCYRARRLENGNA